MHHGHYRSQTRDGQIPRFAREVGVFVAATAVFVDLLLTFLDFDTHRLVEGRGPLLDKWDLVQATFTAIGMLVVARTARSPGSAMFAVVFVLIGLQDQLAWHGSAANTLTNRFDLHAFQNIVPASTEAWGEFLVLAGLAMIGAVLIWAVPDRWERFRPIRRVLTLLLIALFVFATVVDLLAAASAPSSRFALTLLEETGERLTLSATVGYVAAVLAAVPATSPARA